MKWLDYVIRDWRIMKAIPHLSKANVILDIGCGDGELCDAVMTLLLLSFVCSVLYTCIGSLM